MKKLITLFIFAIALQGQAKEGMWLPHLIAQLNYSDMQRMGLQISAEDIYATNTASLKDAIVHFNGGCTGELISAKGLLLTNHHCGFGQIQSHSTLENNYLMDGFWAKSQAEELANPGLYAAIIQEIKDLSNEVLAGTSSDMDIALRDSIIESNSQNILKAAQNAAPHLNFEIKDFFYGNQFLLISKTIFNDVRLVGAPPSSIGKYGADTDNWMWPRHTGDFSMFRVYANAENQPAEYNEANVPYVPKKHLTVSIAGVKEGDFTMVYGFPGSTQQYLPAAEVNNIVNYYNPARIAVRDQILKVLDRKMRTDEATRLKYASKYARISNSWKRWKGEILGVERTNAIAELRAEENEFTRRILLNQDLRDQQHLLAKMVDLYTRRRPINLERYAYIEVGYYGIEASRYAVGFSKLLKLAEGDDEVALQAEADRLLKRIEGFNKNYDFELDRLVALNTLPMYLDAMETQIGEEVSKLKAASSDKRAKVISKMFNRAPFFKENFAAQLKANPKKAAKQIAKSELFKLSLEMYEHFFEVLNVKSAVYNSEIDQLQSQYVRTLQLAFPEKAFYPDANSTLRVAYGEVLSYEAKDAVHYNATTYLSGVMEKYIPGDYEFDLPQKLVDLYEAKDFAPYGENGKMPVCFVATNHTTGGNSGSPVLNARGELIGLNFDRAWDGVMSDMFFDKSICRNVMVDLRYVLFVIDKLGGASYLVDEMDIATKHPDDWETETASD